ncbi:rhodanese-like domain-containing protein [Basilea psittacipulmonis]|uniref:rhodanese-like domain-containing protein n=1 Tax=Basilea psittacipulmonis TaxID=1472345 RepID=UPI00068F0198|nr:rhodanese-like domain-containing protein [Basilea psittacipulmonis]
MKAWLFSGLLLMAAPAWSKTIWIDVRTAQEYQTGHIVNAANMPYQDIVTLAQEAGLDKADRILLYCRSGRRSELAQIALQQAGYTHVQNLGGFQDLVKTGAVKVE